MSTQPIILGTAGHIDHGKTALVRALTGIDTDRLKEEKERGITIELGFAHLDLGGQRFGVVDVPGHERFLRTMVAGATGVDVVLLVIAADEGVMPQTREHLDVCGLLGVTRGVVVLTKRDLVDDEWLALVRLDVAALVAGTFLETAPVIPVSSLTGTGLDDLRAELARLAASLPARSADGPFRLPLDRVFTMKGFGTVVTGTVLGGRVRVGDDVETLPDGTAAKVRGLQVHGVAVNEARAGTRCAVNLAGVAREDVPRGAILAQAGALAASHLVDARLRLLASAPAPLGRRARVLVHHATAQLLAQIVLVDRDELAPGDEALVQLHLDAPIAALPGDRFIVRGFAPRANHGTTIGGGEVLRVHAPKVRRTSPETLAALQAVAAAAPTERVALEIAGAGPAARSRKELGARLGLAPAAIDRALHALVEARELFRAGDLFLHAESVARVERAIVAAVDAFHAAQPLLPGAPREDVRSRLSAALPARLFDALVKELVARAALVADKDILARPRRAAAANDPRIDQLVAALRAAGLETELPGDRALVDAALAGGRIVRIRVDYVVEKGVLEDLRARLRAHLVAHGQITTQEWKAMTGASRKWSIPLAEYFDAEKLTLRVGEIRKLRG